MAYKPQTLAIADGGTSIKYAANLSVYGDGSDGSQTFDGTTTILTMIPISNVYTLTRDLYLASSTVNTSVSIITNGFRIFCNRTLTNNGNIQWNGNNGLNTGVAGASIVNTVSTMSITTVGAGGGAGNVGAGTAGGNITATGGGLGGIGGPGGAGGSAGGVGGTVATVLNSRTLPRSLIQSTISRLISTSTFIDFAFAAGGGGGGGDGIQRGGGGGGGGGTVYVSSHLIAGTGTISANGGNGGNGQIGATSAGGGGGGGGGWLVVISRSVNAAAITGQTITVSGGTGGTRVGAGVNGTNGTNGTTVILTG